MPLNRFKCQRCEETKLSFNDTDFHSGNCGGPSRNLRQCHIWIKLPPKVNVILATSLYMQEYQLDSWPTVYELDRQLNIEAREEKEMQFYQEHKRNA